MAFITVLLVLVLVLLLIAKRYKFDPVQVLRLIVELIRLIGII